MTKNIDISLLNSKLKLKQGITLWLSGLSGAGKSTIANKFVEIINSSNSKTNENIKYEVLDGDDVRENLNWDLGFTKEDRFTNIKRISYIAGKLSKHGVLCIVPAIAPYQEARNIARSRSKNFMMVYVEASINEVSRRDVKGLYAKAIKGEIKNFTGISDPYEEPEKADLVLNTEKLNINEAAALLVQSLIEKNFLELIN